MLCIAGLQIILAGLLGELVIGAKRNSVPNEPIVVVPEYHGVVEVVDGLPAAATVSGEAMGAETVPIHTVRVTEMGT